MLYRPALHGNWNALSLARIALKNNFPTPTVLPKTVLQNRQVFLPDPVINTGLSTSGVSRLLSSRRTLCIPLCFLRAACSHPVILFGLIKASKFRQTHFIKLLIILVYSYAFLVPLSRLYIPLSTWGLRTFGICLRFTVWMVPDFSRLFSGVVFKSRLSDKGPRWQMRPPRSLETSSANYSVTRRHIPVEWTLHLNHFESLKCLQHGILTVKRNSFPVFG